MSSYAKHTLCVSGGGPEEDKADKQDRVEFGRQDNNIMNRDNNIMNRDEQKRSHRLLLA